MAPLKRCLVYWKNELEQNNNDEEKIETIRKLYKVPITVELLRETKIGKIIKYLSRRPDTVGNHASFLLQKWKSVIASSQEGTIKSDKYFENKSKRFTDGDLSQACNSTHKSKKKNSVTIGYAKDSLSEDNGERTVKWEMDSSSEFEEEKEKKYSGEICGNLITYESKHSKDNYAEIPAYRQNTIKCRVVGTSEDICEGQDYVDSNQNERAPDISNKDDKEKRRKENEDDNHSEYTHYDLEQNISFEYDPEHPQFCMKKMRLDVSKKNRSERFTDLSEAYHSTHKSNEKSVTIGYAKISSLCEDNAKRTVKWEMDSGSEYEEEKEKEFTGEVAKDCPVAAVEGKTKSIAEIISERTENILITVKDKKIYKYFDRNLVEWSCAIIASRIEGVYMSFKAASQVAGVNKSLLGKCFNAMRSNMILSRDLQMLYFVGHLCLKYELPRIVLEAAHAISLRAVEIDALRGHTSFEVAASSVILATETLQGKEAAQKIVDGFNLMEVCRDSFILCGTYENPMNCLEEMRRFISILLPDLMTTSF